MNLTISEQIVHSVLQIEMLDQEKNQIGSATGFLFIFHKKISGETVPAIVTNKHVLSSCSYISVTFTKKNSDGSIEIGSTVSTTINSAKSLFHPNEDIDLAILPFEEELSELRSGENNPFCIFLEDNLIPKENQWEHFDAVEDVIMAGYPVGIRDTVNNFPIVRSGITATPPYIDFMGKKEFLVDMPCFKGCSGAPIFKVEDGQSMDKRTGSISFGVSRVFLLGVQHAVPLAQETGTLQFIQTSETAVLPVMPIYLNIGYIIKASALHDFDLIV